MDRKIFDQTVGQAISCAIVFALVVAGMTKLPNEGVFWEILNFGLLMFLSLLNLAMIVGFTSLQNEGTKAFYSYVIPIYPLYLISTELVEKWEWWSYILVLIAYGVCFFILASCFVSRTFTRAIETIAIVLSIFSIPYFYSAIF
tara:strand:+ start:2419 stop:2850 length:432 start_codon:yes stop_codon:yes gene_type:complete